MGIYEYAAIDMLERFDAYVEGSPQSTLMVLSFECLSDVARQAFAASADTLGYGHAAITWATLSASNNLPSSSELNGENLRMLIEGLDPVAIIAADAIAAGTLAGAYNADTQTNVLTRIAGRNVVMLEDFESALSDADTKQRAWHLLKKLSR